MENTHSKGFSDIVNFALGIAILVILIATVVMPQIFGANQTTWDSNTKTIWAVLGVGVAIAVLVYIFSGLRT